MPFFSVASSIQSSSPIPVKYNSSVVKTFWTCQMYPNARTLYFRYFSNCLPTKKVLLKYGIVSSSTCSLCGDHTDDSRHFSVECAIKWRLWKHVLAQYFRNIGFSSEDVYNSLMYLQVSSGNRDAKRYFSILSTTIYQLWIIYWQHGNNNLSPFPPSQTSPTFSRIITHIERLFQSTIDKFPRLLPYSQSPV